MKTGVWANIKRLVKSPKCVACGEDTNFGGKGRYKLCRKHNNWRTYVSLRFKRRKARAKQVFLNYEHSNKEYRDYQQRDYEYRDE